MLYEPLLSLVNTPENSNFDNGGLSIMIGPKRWSI